MSIDTSRRSLSSLQRYMVAATLARSADAAAAVSLVLLAVSPATNLSNATSVGGLLGASLMAPYLLSPLIGQRLDAVRDTRLFLAGAFALYGVLLATAGILLGQIPTVLVGAVVLLAGCCGPLLTGGLSSRLTSLIDPDYRTQRQAEAWDGVSYGLGATLGPAGVAAIAAIWSPVLAVLILGALPVIAAGVVLRFPTSFSSQRRTVPMPIAKSLLLLVRDGRLRRVNAFTCASSLSLGGLTLVAVVLGERLSGSAGAGPVLTAAFGLGNLLGSLSLARFPLRGEPETLIRWLIGVQAGAFLLCAASPSLPIAIAAFGVLGLGNAPLITATFTARSLYAPANARAQVFVTMVGVKTAVSSAGAALAGLTIGVGPRPLLVVAAIVLSVSVVALTVDRRVSPPTAEEDPGSTQHTPHHKKSLQSPAE